LLIFIKFFNKNKTNIRNDLFKTIEKNIENLELDTAQENLDNIKDDFEYFTDKQKSNYYIFI
jgi:hypothetical protein